jgi:hypothetical protein
MYAKGRHEVDGVSILYVYMVCMYVRTYVCLYVCIHVCQR